MNTDLFPETTVAPDAPAPERKLDLRTEFLKERYGLEQEWVWHSFEAIEDRPPFRFAKYSGGVYPFAKTRGKNKGRTDYKRPVLGTERIVVLDDQEFTAWLPGWEAKTGLCSTCRGSGQKWTEWSAAEGSRYIDCPKCSATGSAQGIEARRAEPGTGSVHESAVGSADAPDPSPSPSSKDRPDGNQ